MEGKAFRIGGQPAAAGSGHGGAPFHGDADGVFRSDDFRDAVLGNAVLHGDDDAVFGQVVLQKRDGFMVVQLLGHEENDIVFAGHILRQEGVDRHGYINGSRDVGAGSVQGVHMGVIPVDQVNRDALPGQIGSHDRSQGTGSVYCSPHLYCSLLTSVRFCAHGCHYSTKQDADKNEKCFPSGIKDSDKSVCSPCIGRMILL